MTTWHCKDAELVLMTGDNTMVSIWFTQGIMVEQRAWDMAHSVLMTGTKLELRSEALEFVLNGAVVERNNMPEIEWSQLPDWDGLPDNEKPAKGDINDG